MEYRILGTTEVVRDGRQVAMGGTRRRALLARLLVASPRAVPAEELIEDLWEGSPPPGAKATLQSHIAGLRRALSAERLVTTAGAYAVVVSENELDSHAFDREVDQADRYLRDGSAHDAATSLTEALSRWRGRVLDDAKGAAWAAPTVARLEERRTIAEELAVEARLVMGNHEEAAALAETAVTADPLREQRWAQLMLALYRSGRQAQALRTFQRARALLIEEIGLEPSAELQDLEARILAQDRGLAWVPRAARPVKAARGSDAGQLPLPTRLTPTANPSAAFTGRDLELTQIADAYKAATTDQRLEVVLVSGEPGIGKTALANNAARAAHGAGADVVFGGCEEDLRVPYQPWITALGHLVDHAGIDLLNDYVATHGSNAVRLVPALGRRCSVPRPPTGDDPDADRFLLLEAAVKLMSTSSAVRPLVVLLDDLHWADAASLQLLRHLVRSTGPMRVLVIGTYRDSEVPADHPLATLLADLRREHGVARIGLRGLTGPDIRELVEAAVGDDTDSVDDLVHSVHQQTDGNPFFVVEVVRHLADTGARDAGSIPGSVREVVGQRVARLGEEARRVLTLASVVGADFDLELLALVADSDEDRLLDLMEQATRFGLVAESGEIGRYRFLHALIQHTLYSDMSATRRQRAHRRIAEALEDLAGSNDERVAELAWHWLSATRPADADRAQHHARRAGDIALAALAPADAARWYAQALELLDTHGRADDRNRCELLVRLGDALRQVGQEEHRATLLEAATLARRLGAVDLVVAAALVSIRGFSSVGEFDPDRAGMIQAALDLIGPTDSPARARLLAGLAEVTDAREWSRRRQLAVDAQAVAERVGDEATELAVGIATYADRAQPDTHANRLVETARMVVLADAIGDARARVFARMNRIHTCLEAADLPEVDLRLGEIDAIVTPAPLPILRWYRLVAHSWRLHLAGRLEAAEEAATEGLAIGSESGQIEAFAAYGGNLFVIRRHQGRLAEIADLMVDAAAQHPTIPALRAAVAVMLCELGQLDRARVVLASDLADGFAEFPYDHVWLTSMLACADAVADLGDQTPAALLHERLSPFAGLVACSTGNADSAVARLLGRLCTVLGRYDEGDTHFRAAAAIHARLDAPYWIARTAIEHGELLVARRAAGDLEVARVRCEAAARTATANGLAGLTTRVSLLEGKLGS